ncbi:inactive serine/threonine-protein kinase PLK5 isoform X3 [Strix aluco]|uniref:inactive serine/threonine-protein kinase PLK5 isoform X3 n=1 Tax=Strix aluco TaxID=111821 RepID=UPI003DA49CE0
MGPLVAGGFRVLLPAGGGGQRPGLCGKGHPASPARRRGRRREGGAGAGAARSPASPAHRPPARALRRRHPPLPAAGVLRPAVARPHPAGAGEADGAGGAVLPAADHLGAALPPRPGHRPPRPQTECVGQRGGRGGGCEPRRPPHLGLIPGRRALCGTPSYLAPEVLDRKGHGVPSDVWALGCSVYAVLTGSPPFEAAERQELYRRIRAARYPLPPHLSPHARVLIARLLAPEPAARPSLRDVLEHGFFTQGFTPARLPPRACRSVPVFVGREPLGRALRGAAAALARGWPCPLPPRESSFLGRTRATQAAA